MSAFVISTLAQSQVSGEMVPMFLITLFFVPIVGVSAVAIIGWILQREIEPAQGFGALTLIVGMMVFAIYSNNQLFSGIVIVVLVVMMAFFPFAREQMGRLELRNINTDQLEKSLLALKERPDNTAAKLAVAHWLFIHYQVPQAVAIGQETIDGLSNELDPVRNASLRDIFYRDQLAIKNWRRQLRPGQEDQHVVCTRCKFSNPPNAFWCQKCGALHLVEMFRNQNSKSKFLGKLVLVWVLIAVLLVGTAAAAVTLQGPVLLVVLAVGIGLVGGSIYYLTRSPIPE